MFKNFLPIPKHSLEYNKELDGLRGIAILLVLFFHLFPSLFSFGYVGVDIFFVLSGYLITGIIISKIESNTFSFLEFYRNRIRRIFPAMIIVLLVSMVAGYIFLFPKELELFSKHVKSSFLFYQNITLINEAGYWDEASTKKPLLHFWSLSIEEQFYLFCPFILMVFSKIGKNWTVKLLILFLILFFVSLANFQDPFYGSFSRFWELGFGGLAYTFSKSSTYLENRDFSMPAVIVFVLSIAFAYNNIEYSLFKTLMIVIATGFLILSFNGSKNTIFNSNILLFFGLISYPLYLWHYVIIGYLHIFGFDVPSVGIWIALASIVLAYLTYRFIEIYSRKQTSYYFSAALLAIALCLVFVSMYVHKTRGLNKREHMKNIASANFDRAPAKDSNATALIEKIVGKNHSLSHMRSNTKDLKEPFFMIIGDSHAYSGYDAIANELKKKKYKTICISNNSIPPLVATKYAVDKKMKNKNKTVLKIIENIKPQRIIWISRNEIYATGESFAINPKTKEGKNYKTVHFFENMGKTFEYFSKKNIDIYFVLENPEIGFSPEDCLKRPFLKLPINSKCSIPKNLYLKRQEKFIYNVNKIASQYKNIKIIDTQNIFCDSNMCYAKRNSELLYFDDNHLNLTGAKLQAKEIVRQIFIYEK